jgi:sporulation protein YlmC with PRC-barrel domain
VRGLRRRAAEATPLKLGRPVWCSDGLVGHLADVVVEPQERRLTHLVVEEEEGIARLVPAELLLPKPTRNLNVVLSCTQAEVHACKSIRGFDYLGVGGGLPTDDERSDIGVEETILMPGMGAVEFGGYAGDLDMSYGVTYDRTPSGSAELRRTSTVLSIDGTVVGHVDGFLVEDGRMTHVVLQSGGHIFKSRQLAIPVEAVESIETDRITLSMSRDAVESFRGDRSTRRPFG